MEEEEEFDDITPIPVSVKGTEKILNQMKKGICKVENEDNQSVGFFVKFSYPEDQIYLTALITNNSILNKKNIAETKKIYVKFYEDEEQKEITIDKNRKIFLDKYLSTTIIEIIPEKDKINLDNFIEADQKVRNHQLNDVFTNASVYVLNFTKDEDIEVSYGILSEITEKNFSHNCTIERSSFSPIFNLSNFKIIGIHFGLSPDSNLSIGSFLRFPEIKPETKKLLKKMNDIENKNKSSRNLGFRKSAKNKNANQKILTTTNNKMTIKYLVNQDKKIQIFGREFVKNYKGKCKIIINKTTQDLYQYLDTKNLNNIKSIEIQLIEIKPITDMSKMFNNCIWLQSLPDIANWDTSNVTDMSFMFAGCFSLTNFDGISKWDMSNVLDISYMFWGCTTFKTIPDISNWDTSNIQDISYLFNRCLLLESLPDISKWNTECVTHMEYLFNKCESLTTLPDISKWDIDNVKNFRGMFNGCKNLLEIPEKFRKHLVNANTKK